MFIRVSSAGASLGDPYDFKRFKVTTPDVASIGRFAPEGLTVEGDHCWIEVAFLKTLGPSGDADWQRSVDGMVRAVAKLGWASGDLAKVRAHIEPDMN